MCEASGGTPSATQVRTAAEPSAYQTILSAYTQALPVMWLVSALGGITYALLGHPLLGLGGAVVAAIFDWMLVRRFRGWARTAAEDDSDRGIARLAVCVCMRSALLLAPCTAMALMTGRPADAVFVIFAAAALLVVAAVQSVMSQVLFRAAAAPPLAALAAAIAALAPADGAPALFGALAMLGLLLLLIDAGARRAKLEFLARQAEKNALIDELRAAHEEAVLAREEARRASLAKSNFLATMSHEIRTPMNGVLGMAELLGRSRLTGAQRRQLDTLVKSGEILMVILNDILDLSRIDAGRMPILKAPCELRPFLEELADFWRPTALTRSLDLTLDLSPELPAHMSIDAIRVRQVLFNLVGNALKFTPAGGVSVRVAESGGRLVFQVADSGVGIAQDDLPRLFERFSQTEDVDVRRFGGAGLGLAICRQLAELMGGDIAVASRLGEGSTFTLSLPFEAADAPTAEEARATEAAAADVEAPTLSILAADDNPTNLMVLEQLLGALGFAVKKAGGGAEALEALKTHAFDLVLMDIQMPEMTGIDVLNAVRASPGPNQATPLIAVTADAMTLGAERYMDLGFAGYVTKPLHVQTLIDAMLAAVANGEGEVARAV